MLRLIKNWTLVSWLFLVFLASSYSLFTPSFFRVHDYTHGTRISEMTRALRDGHFPVRWSQNLGFGYGMPLYNFYAPLPFYVGSFVYWLGLDIIGSVKALYIISAIGTIWGAYKLGTVLYGSIGGALVATLYTLAPYRAVNLFVRGSLSEAWAMMFFPWILFGIIRTIQGSKWGWLTLSLSTAGLLLSHNLSSFVFVGFAGIWSLYWLLREHHFPSESSLKAILKVMFGSGLGFGLAAFYVIPAFAEKQYTQIDTILTGYFDYHNHFLYIRQFFWPNWKYGGSSWGPQDDISFFVGYLHLIGLALTGLAVGSVVVAKVRRGFRKATPIWKQVIGDNELLIIVSSLLAGAAFYFSLLKSVWIWESVPLLNFIQFPWRFLSVAMLFVSIVASAWIQTVSSLPKRVLMTSLFIVLACSSSIGFFRPEVFLSYEHASTYYYDNELKNRQHMSEILRDYIPATMPLELKPRDSLLECQLSNCGEIIVSKTHQYLVKTSSSTPYLLEFGIADFPGWTAYLDGQRTEKTKTEKGTISVSVPASEHLVGLVFEDTQVRSVSQTLSIVSILVLLYMLLPTKLDLKKKLL